MVLTSDLGDDGQVGGMRDGGERFASKAERVDRLQVLKLGDLARGESFAEDGKVLVANASPVVLDRQELQAAFLCSDDDALRAW
jgi:hypothetical protein